MSVTPAAAPAPADRPGKRNHHLEHRPAQRGSVKIGIVHVDPTTAGTVTWTGGTTGLGQAAQAALACISVGYKEEDTAGALTFTSTITAPAIGTLIMSIPPGVAGVAFVPRIMGVY